MTKQTLTHLNHSGRAHMVDVTSKQESQRVAIASGRVVMSPSTIELIHEGGHKKGDVLAVAQVAGIMAAKKTSDMIPMCHLVGLTGVDIEFNIRDSEIQIQATARTYGRTGVEMEALTAVSVCALCIYDMCKAVDKEMVVTDIKLLSKSGGKSDFKVER